MNTGIVVREVVILNFAIVYNRIMRDRGFRGVFRLLEIDIANKSSYVGLDIPLNLRRKESALEAYGATITFLFRKLQLEYLNLITLVTSYSAKFLYEKLGFVKEHSLQRAFYRATGHTNGLIYPQSRNKSQKK